MFDRVIAHVRRGPLQGRWFFASAFLAQLGHLFEHIAKQLTGSGVFGADFDTEISHLIFNGAIALISLLLVALYPRNPWVYPLVVLSVFHGIEHVYTFEQFLRTGGTNGPGLFGMGGAFGVLPLERLDLHNAYNGIEMILIALGFWHETDAFLEDP